MSKDVLKILEERGLVKQCTHLEPLRKQLQQPTPLPTLGEAPL